MRACAVSVAVGVVGRSGAVSLALGRSRLAALMGGRGDAGRGRHPIGFAFLRIEQGAGPGITINAEVRGCFVAGYRDGTGAEFASIQTSMEGDPIATIYRTVPGGGVELLVDSTQDRFGEKVWRRTTCRVLLNDQREVFGLDGCDEGVAIP